jgi:hypothetical protein
MCMKEYCCCLKFRRGDNSTYTFTKRGWGVVYLLSATPTKQVIEFLWNFTVVVHNLQMCMKEYRCCLKFRRGDNSTCLIPIFLHAHLQVVYYKCVKFHKNPISRLGRVALTRYTTPPFRERISRSINPSTYLLLLSRKGEVVYLVSATLPKRLIGFLWNFTHL